MANKSTKVLSDPYAGVGDTLYSGEENILASLNKDTLDAMAKFLATLRVKYPDLQFNVVEGARSSARQLEQFSKGASGIKSGGMHQKKRAIDAYPIIGGEVVNPRTPAGLKIYQEIGAVAESVGLNWGGRWQNLRDFGHFELKE